MEGYKVLVVEDDETARRQLSKAIKKEGYQVLMAEDGRAGVEQFKKETPHIIVTDLKMPGMGGVELMHTVRGLSKDVQVIVVTAFGETDTAVSALREGALDYIKKPIDLDELNVALGRAKERVAKIMKSKSFPTLLLADDEDKIRERLARVLDKEGWDVDQVSNGEEAVAKFREKKVDIVLLDIKMPKKDGLQALHEMRKISDDFEAIILTGYGDETSAVQALRDGAINFLKKPIDLDQMILAVQKALEKLHADRSLKFRLRELELAEQIMGTITSENELLVDLRRRISEPTRDFAQRLINAIPVNMLVMDFGLNIFFSNICLEKALKCKPEKLDEEMIKKLHGIGVNELTYENLRSVVDKITASPQGTIETIPTGKYSYLTLAPVTVLLEGQDMHCILVIIRGERK
ncbi:MAG: response regulator [Pseudomonadota bacterium]